jgi:hypothetical protein
MKHCYKCGLTKPIDDFHRDRTTKDGRCAKCKTCKNVPPKPVVVFDINPTDLGWLAGLLEGEGSFSLVHYTDRRKGRHPCRYGKVSLNMTDRDVVERVVSVTGLGRVWGPTRSPSRAQHKATYSWAIQGARKVEPLVTLLQPLMGERRRQQIDRVLVACRS